MNWVFLAAAILSEVAATVALRASGGLRRRRWIAPVAVGYVASFVLLGFSLHFGMPIGIAYGTWAATGIALTAVLARWIFKEPLTRTMILGIGLITVGVVIVEIGAAGAHAGG